VSEKITHHGELPRFLVTIETIRNAFADGWLERLERDPEKRMVTPLQCLEEVLEDWEDSLTSYVVYEVLEKYDGGTDEPTDRRSEQMKWLGHAMMLVRDFPSWSNAKIAREVGKHPSTLSRSSEFQAFADQCRNGTGEQDA